MKSKELKNVPAFLINFCESYNFDAEEILLRFKSYDLDSKTAISSIGTMYKNMDEYTEDLDYSIERERHTMTGIYKDVLGFYMDVIQTIKNNENIEYEIMGEIDAVPVEIYNRIKK